jgi:hypothetical protein
MASVVLEIAPGSGMARADWLEMRRAALSDQTRTVKLRQKLEFDRPDST